MLRFVYRALLPAIIAIAVSPVLTNAQSQAQAPAQEPIQVPKALLERPVRIIVPPRRIGVMGEAEISLDQVVSWVLANNLDVEASRIDMQVASLRITGAFGAYDPRVGLDTGYTKAINPVSSLLGGGAIAGQVQNETANANPFISGLIPHTGGSYTATFANNRNSTDNTFATLNPQYPTTLTLSAIQPLWRGLRYDDPRRQIDIAKSNSKLTDEQFRARVTDTVTLAVNSYYELIYAYRNYQVQAEAVDLSRRQVESNQRQAQQGILAPIDIVDAETQLATFEQTLYLAQQNLTRAENTLKALILPDRRAALWNAALIPISPLNLDKPDADYQTALDQALQTRPELVQASIARQTNNYNVKYYREQTKPQVDLVASYSSAGLAGAAVAGGGFFGGTTNTAVNDRVNELSVLAGLPVIPPTPPVSAGPPAVLLGGYGTSLSNLFGYNYTTASAALRISLPLRNRAAESNLAVSLADNHRLDNQVAQTEMRIEGEVRDAMQSMETARARLDAAIIGRESAELQYQSEQRKFQEGTSSAFLVTQRQSTMILTRTNELRAQTDLSRAIADFDRASARTLDVRKINIRGAAAPPQPVQPRP